MPQSEQTIKAFKTAVFKLHNLSRRKQAMIEHALFHNHMAYSKALKSISPLIGNIDRKSTRLNSSHSQQSRMPSSA
mgnify:CR=1 FL=1